MRVGKYPVRGGTKNKLKDRVSTAVNNRRSGNFFNNRLFPKEKDKIEMPNIKHTESKIDLLYERLKQCQGDGGVVDPLKILEAMNNVQIEEDPDAYVP